MNEELNKAMEQISDKHIAEAAAFRKKRRPYWLGAVAAVLVIALLVGIFWDRTPSQTNTPQPTILDHTPVIPDSGVQNSSPSSYYCFESTEEIHALLEAAKLDDQGFQNYVYSLAFRPYSDVPVLREGAQNLGQFLSAVRIPCIDGKFYSLYYYLYHNVVEIFCDYNDIRYQFLINIPTEEYSGTPALSNVTIGTATFDMYEKDQRLHGIFILDGCRVHAIAFTNNPEDVDFSAFTFEYLLEAQSGPSTEPTPPVVVPLTHLVAEPDYPEMVPHPGPNAGSYKDWRESQAAQYDQPDGYADSLHTFFRESLPVFLQTAEAENVVCSPVNIYMALAMLAECTEGTSRQQILDLLGADSIESLRQQAGHVWNAHYCDDGYTTLLLGNSLWLDNEHEYFQQCVDTLANDYYASVFWGDLGSDEMNEHLRSWVNEQTGGLLEDQANTLELDPRTVIALASTIEYRVAWSDSFNEKNNTQQTFHGTNGDITATFLNRSDTQPVYWGENFTAIYLQLEDYGKMWLYLPDEGVSISELLEDEAATALLFDEPANIYGNQAKVNLAMPKFDISYDTDLIANIQSMGVTDVFSLKTADMSGITTANAAVSEINHAARVVIDEDGLLAAAYTVIEAPGYGIPDDPPKEIDFVLDRPFLFVITSRDNLPLFAGVVEHP